MNKNKIRLTESQLHKVINESVKRVLNENWCDNTSIQSVVYHLIDSNKYEIRDAPNGASLTLTVPSVGLIRFIQGSVVSIDGKYWEDMTQDMRQDILCNIIFDLCKK